MRALFVLFYQAEIRHPQLLKSKITPRGEASNAVMLRCHYGNSIFA